MQKRSRLFLPALIGLLLIPVGSTDAQSLDGRVASAVYGWETPVARAVIGAVDRTAYPAFYGSVPASWVYCAASATCGPAEAGRFTATMAGTYLVSIGLKRVFRRARPFDSFHDRPAKLDHIGARGLEDSFSMPSGHAALAAALAVAWAKETDLAVFPLALWATGVGVSRVWLGVHYPSDVLAGWLVGVGTALIVYAAFPPSSHGGSNGPQFRLSWTW